MYGVQYVWLGLSVRWYTSSYGNYWHFESSKYKQFDVLMSIFTLLSLVYFKNLNSPKVRLINITVMNEGSDFQTIVYLSNLNFTNRDIRYLIPRAFIAFKHIRFFSLLGLCCYFLCVNFSFCVFCYTFSSVVRFYVHSLVPSPPRMHFQYFYTSVIREIFYMYISRIMI